MLFENSVASVQLIDAGWEEDVNNNFSIPKKHEREVFKTELRTVIGSVHEIKDDIITVDTGRSKEYVPIDEQSEWIFAEGDNVRLDCVITEDESAWNPSIGIFGNIVEIKKIVPNSTKNEIGRVTAVFKDYAIFDESVILNYSYATNQTQKIELWEEYEYEAIETSIFLDGRNFNWRITKLIKKIVNIEDRQIDSIKKVQMNDEFFELRQSSRDVAKFTSVFNNSDQKVIITKCEVTSNSGFIQLQNPDKKIELRPFNGAYKIYFNICPKQFGSYVEELTVDFGSFKKKCLLKFQVTKSCANRQRLGRFSRGSEIIPGQKISMTLRFIEIRIPEYLIPDQFRHNFDFKKQTQLIVHDFTLHDHRFLIEELEEQNYLAKMRYCLYLEEIAMENHFERYRIDRAHFENKDEYLKLDVEGVNEKRPSITMGDTIHATDPFQPKSQHIYQGIIHKVEQNCILAKFHSEFHHTHNRKDFRIDFYFSRTTFRRQQFALDQVLSSNGLGLNFIFPRILNIKKTPQVDVRLSENGNLLLHGKESEFYNKSLNIYQKNAVINVLRGENRPLPYIIYGPPGKLIF